MLKKKCKLDETETSNLTNTQNLDGAILSLNGTTKAINHTLKMLTDFNKDSHRQAQVTRCSAPYELVTQQEIANASHELGPDLIPECHKLLEKARYCLYDLSKKETNLKESVNEQEAMIEKLKRDINSAKGNSSANTVNNKKREELKNTKEKLMREINMEKQKKAKGIANLRKLKATNEEALNKQKEREPSNEDWQQYQTNLINEIARLKSEHTKKMELLEEKKRLQAEENRRAELSLMDSLSTREHIVLFTGQSKTVQNAIIKLRESGTTAPVTRCERLCDEYLQALREENKSIQVGPSNIEKIKTLCTLILANRPSGKTTGRIIELLLLKGEVSIEEFLEEFPWTEDERHNFTNVTINLVQNNILLQNGTNFSLKQ